MAHSSRSVLLLGLLGALSAAGWFGWRSFASRPDHLLRQGQAALERGDLEAAESFAERLARLDDNPQQHLLWGMIRLAEARHHTATAEALGASPWEGDAEKQKAQDQLTKGLQALARVRADDPLAAEATVLAAECLVRAGEHPLAAEVLRTVVRRQPNHREAHRWLAAVYMDLGSPAEAVAHFREWARLDPEAGRPHRWIGFFLNAADEGAPAVAAYREAVRRRLDPATRATVVQELAELLLRTNADHRGALEALNQCPEPFDREPGYRALLADCHWRHGNQAEAVRLAEEALRADPACAAALRVRAALHLADDQPRAALPLLEKAVGLNPHDLPCRQHLMQVYQQLGHGPRAEEQRQLLEQTSELVERLRQLRRQVARSSGDDVIRVRVGEVCRQLNRLEEAQTWFRAALACNPRNEQARQALSSLPGAPGKPAILPPGP